MYLFIYLSHWRSQLFGRISHKTQHFQGVVYSVCSNALFFPIKAHWRSLAFSLLPIKNNTSKTSFNTPAPSYYFFAIKAHWRSLAFAVLHIKTNTSKTSFYHACCELLFFPNQGALAFTGVRRVAHKKLDHLSPESSGHLGEASSNSVRVDVRSNTASLQANY